MRTTIDKVGAGVPDASSDRRGGTPMRQDGDAVPGVRHQQQSDPALSTQAQPGEAGTQLTSAPVWQAAASTGEADSAAGTGDDAVRDVGWCREQAERGDVPAQVRLARMYRCGEGVKKDPAQAFAWYSKAAQQGDADAQCWLGTMYHGGAGVKEDPAQAAAWYAKAAQQGNADAQHWLGLMYGNGDGIEKDPGQAVTWFRKAAQQGNENAQYWMGFAYEYGEGVERDPAQAADWYRKAAQQGNAVAQCSLGKMYCTGEGVKQDLDEAVSWLSKAGQQGDPEAQTMLIRIYRNGTHAEPDVGKAIDWVLRRMNWIEPPEAVLYMACCEMDDAMFAAVMARFPDEAVIRELDLESNLIGDAGALAIAGMIDRCAALLKVNLGINPIGQPGLRELAQAMRRNTTVRELIFDFPDKADEPIKAELERIAAECKKNGRIAELLRQQGSWREHGWTGFVPDLLWLLEQSLIRTDIKLRHSASEDTKHRLLEMQLCLSHARV